MIVAVARKLLIALWRLVTVGEIPAGVILHRSTRGTTSQPTRLAHIKTATNVLVCSKVCGDRLRSSTWGIGRLHWLVHICDSARPTPFPHTFSVVGRQSMEPAMFFGTG
jgi:hypothetical protein